MVFESAFINRPGFDPHSLLGAPLLLTPTRGDYLGEHTAKAFDEILPGRVLEENAILEAEKSEGTYDPDYLPQQEARDMFGTFPDTPKVRHSHAMSEEDWKASPFYRKEIEYRPDMTRTRARIMAENFDERRYRDALIANGDEVYGPVMKALSFGATLLGSLPDPVNVLPLGGGMRAASLAGKTGLKAAVKAGAKAGVVEGAAGAALSDAIVFPDLRARGEDLGFLDFLLDTAFGATLGGGLGALGGGIHGYLGNRRIEAQDRLARRARLRHEELLREADEREKARLAMETEYGSLDDDFLGLIDDADMDIAQRRRWRDLTGEFREQLIKDAGFSTQDAEAMSDILGAHAEVMAPMFGMEPGAWLERRLAGFRNTTPEEFEAARETFLYDARGMETMALRQIESEGRRANPVADTVYGQLDRAAIREAYGQDTVNAIEARYGKGVFAKTRGAKAASKGTLSNDSLAHELVRRGLLPEGSSLDDMVNYLATGEGVDTGRALYQFLGEQGAGSLDRAQETTTRLDNLGIARQMGESGKDARVIKLATGWERGADGKWRYEVPDGRIREDVNLVERESDGMVYRATTLGELYDAPALYVAYPELKDIEIAFRQLGDTFAIFDGDRISLSDTSIGNKEEIKSSLLHEIQHAIQDKEGFARGGNEDVVYDILSDRYIQEAWNDPKADRAAFLEDVERGDMTYEEAGGFLKYHLKKIVAQLTVSKKDKTRIDALFKRAFNIPDEELFQGYLRLAGEVESRNVQARKNMSPEERRASLAAATEDVAREDQIFLYEGMEASSMARPLPQRFAEMPGVEADSSQWFGEEKAIATDTKGLRKNLKKWAKENFSGKTTVSNADTGWEVLVTPKGIEDSLSHGFDEPLARSVPFIPQIIESGIHVASTEKKAGLMSHIFANKIRLDGKDYVVGFVLREDDNGNRFYDHELTEIIDPGWLYRDPLSKKETLYTGPANRGDVMNILRDKLGVNDGSGRVMFQTGADPANARGAIVFRPEDGQALIALFKGKADISTVIHEGAGHFFLENLRAAAQLPNAPAWVRDGWGDVAKAIGADADPARAIGTEAHEAFANMAVDYFRRGEAPSIALTTTFQRFARWLAHIYRALTRRGELKDVTPEVKRIMDRLLVAEDQLRAREINRRVVNARNDEADLLRSGLAGREKRDVMRAQEKALADMAAGRPVDVGPVLRESQVLRKARALQREFPDPENRNASSDRAAPEPDYSVERQDDFPPAPEAKSGEDAEMADMDADAAVDADVEARIADLEARGNLDGEDAALLADAADQAARAERYGEIGQSVLECVMEVVE